MKYDSNFRFLLRTEELRNLRPLHLFYFFFKSFFLPKQINILLAFLHQLYHTTATIQLPDQTQCFKFPFVCLVGSIGPNSKSPRHLPVRESEQRPHRPVCTRPAAPRSAAAPPPQSAAWKLCEKPATSAHGPREKVCCEGPTA